MLKANWNHKIKALFSPSLHKVETTLVITELPLHPFSCECCDLCVLVGVFLQSHFRIQLFLFGKLNTFQLSVYSRKKSKTSMTKYPFTHNYLPGNHYPIILSHKITSSQATLACPCNVCVYVFLLQDTLDFTGGGGTLGCCGWLPL